LADKSFNVMLDATELGLQDGQPPLRRDLNAAVPRAPTQESRLNVDHCVLGEAADADGRYMYLLEPVKRRILAAARFSDAGDHLALHHFSGDDYAHALFLLLLQKARREGRHGVCADAASSSDEAKSVCAQFRANPPVVDVLAATAPDIVSLGAASIDMCCLDATLVSEIVARRNADRHFGRTVASRVRLNRLRLRDIQTYSKWHTGAGVLALVRQSLTRRDASFGAAG